MPASAGPVTTAARKATTSKNKSKNKGATKKKGTAKPWAPLHPQPSAAAAAYELVGAWSESDRALALEDASPPAVAGLFAYRYPYGGPQFRGCSTPPGNGPVACVWRSGNDLLSMQVRQFASGWAVTGTTMET